MSVPNENCASEDNLLYDSIGCVIEKMDSLLDKEERIFTESWFKRKNTGTNPMNKYKPFTWVIEKTNLETINFVFV